MRKFFFIIILVNMFPCLLFSAGHKLNFSEKEKQLKINLAKKYPKLSGILIKLVENRKKLGDMKALSIARQFGALVSSNNKITVVIEAKNKFVLNEIERVVKKNKGKILSRYKNLIKIKINIKGLEKLNKVAEVKKIRNPLKPIPHSIAGEEITLTRSSIAMSNGVAGTGIKVAVIDGGFKNLSAATQSKELPNTVICSDFSGTGLTNDSEHGTAVAEIIYEMATNIQLYLFKIADSVDLGNAKDYCKIHGINIINHSMGWVNTEWGDGTGIICDIANDANNNGILWVNSAGNSARGHWQDNWRDVDSDNYMDFNGTTNEGEVNEIGYYPAGSTIQVYLSWNDVWNGYCNNDYDLVLYKWNGSWWDFITSGDEAQDGTGNDYPVESISYSVEAGAGYYGVKIYRYSGVPKECQLFNFNSDFENYTTAHSLMAPADASGVFTVGAINYSNWENASCPVEEFSSQGPTQDGRIKPDICGVDYNTNFTYGRFSGTSSASPCVAGAAAIVWSAYNGYTKSDVKLHLESDAIDTGDAGKDNIFGYGRVNIMLDIENTPATPIDEGEFTYKTNIIFEWNGNIIKNKLLSYVIQINTNTNTIQCVITNVGTNTKYIYTGAKHCKIYYAKIMATNCYNKKYSLWSDGITIDTNAPLPVALPAPVDEGDLSDASVSFYWNKATDSESGIKGYSVMVATSTNPVNVIDTKFVTSTNITIVGIHSNMYFIKVAAVNGANLSNSYSGWSDGILVDAVPSETTILPAEQYFFNKVTVSFYTTETNANIYFSTNGTNPEINERYLYKNPFVLNIGEHIIKYFSSDTVGNKETLHTISYIVIKNPTEDASVYNRLINLSDDKNNILRFVFSKSGGYEIKIYSITGEVVKEWDKYNYNAGDVFEWDLKLQNTFLSGNIYFVNIKSDSFNKIFKILVVK